MSNLVLGRAPARLLNVSGLWLALVFALLVLAGCETAEERAEGHYQSGMELLEEGEVERALVEFRNVFKLNGNHKDARLAYARIQRDRGFLQESFGQYRRLVEQYPDNLEGRLALAEMALQARDWESVERHATKAVEIAPENLKAQSLANTVAYFHALRDKDDQARNVATEKAHVLIKQDADLPSARQIVIDELIRSANWEEALRQIDLSLEQTPDDLVLYQMRLGILQQTGDVSGTQTMLEQMVERFPDNAAIKDTLVAFYVVRENVDAAENLLRTEAENSTDTEKTQRLIGFLLQFRGAEAAVAELNKVIDEGRLPPLLFKAILARLNFDQGEQEEAIAALEAELETAERNDDTRDLEIELARMYFQQGNAVAARQLVESVLLEDASHPSAVKLKAAWLIQDDETDDAIIMLRDALSKSPQDATLLSLMAQAHEREGNRELMSEMLSLAVEASGKGAAESMRYASYLVSEKQFLPAESVLIDALRASPTNAQLLGALGAVYIQLENWAQAAAVADRLNELGSDETKALATQLTAQSLAAQNRSNDLRQLLEGVAADPDTKKAGEVAIFRTILQGEGPQEALAYIEKLLAETPEDPEYRFLRAGTLVALDRMDEAESIYRQMIEENPERVTVWTNLYRLKRLVGDDDAASAILKDALAAIPENPALRVALAEELQKSGEIENAISIYQDLYDKNPNSVIVANNLASLMADYRADDESLKKAFAVARRLRNSEVPALQDTYGWIAFRMGNAEEALPYLENAAKGLPDDATVQFHYGMALSATGSSEMALEQLQKVQVMIDPENPPQFADDLRAEMEKLQSQGTEAPKE